MPATFNVGASDVATLIADINTANNNGQSNTINLTASAYDLTTVDNFWYGPDGLPAISSNLTINGNGANIQRDTAAPYFRLFAVSGGFDGLAAGSLTLNDLTLQGGRAQGGNSGSGGGGLGAGGAIFNQGTVTLTGVTLTDNEAFGGISGGGSGGGGGMGQDGLPSGAGGGFGGSLPGTFGGTGGSGSVNGGGGGGSGFGAGDNGQNALTSSGGAGGGQGGFGGVGGGGALGGDGGGGGVGILINGFGGGDFGFGGLGGFSGGGGAGGGGGEGYAGGGGGFGGGGGSAVSNLYSGGEGGFGAGGGKGGLSFGFGGYGGGDNGGGGAGMGGAIFNMFGTTNLTNCTLTVNTARGGDSGIINGGGGSGYGAAIFNLDGQLSLTFTTFASNTVAGGAASVPGHADGGAVYNLAFGNTLTAGAQTATATITDSILSNTTGGNDLSNTVVNGSQANTATVTLNGPNLVVTSDGPIGGTNPLTADPQLGSLQNNGGPTSTLAIPTNSPAVQAGTPVAGVTADQRGLLRPGTPSLGAFEAQPALPQPSPPPSSPPGSPPPTTPTPAPAGSLTGFALGFVPGVALDVFEVDSQGQMYAQAFSLFGMTGNPVFISDTLQFSAAAFSNGQLLALQQGGGQLFLFDVLNLLNPSVDQAILGNLVIEEMLLATLGQ